MQRPPAAMMRTCSDLAADGSNVWLKPKIQHAVSLIQYQIRYILQGKTSRRQGTIQPSHVMGFTCVSDKIDSNPLLLLDTRCCYWVCHPVLLLLRQAWRYPDSNFQPMNMDLPSV